ncbi:MAG: hypothetical protein AAFN81_04145 [Bacteroidota bacterium]
MKKTFSLFMIVGLAVVFLASTSVNTFSTYTPVFKSVEMPSQLSNGDPFPTDSTVVDGWVAKSLAINGLETNRDIISHAWGLWAALMQVTRETNDGRQMRRFETWPTPQDIMRAMKHDQSLADVVGSSGKFQGRTKFNAFADTGDDKVVDTPGDAVGRVKYSPAAAQYALDNMLFDASVMQSKAIPNGIAKVTLPNNSVLLKPIYRVLSNYYKVYNGMYRFHVWGGKDDCCKGSDAAFSDYVYICTDPNDSRIDNVNVFSISTMIHHKMTAAEAEEYNNTPGHSREGAENPNNVAQAGDIVILLGMHVSTRESTRWTWQSFYWSPNPNNPLFPSSSTMAAGRGTASGLDNAAKHYAVSLGYSMLSPAAPLDLDLSKGASTDNRGSVYALNPYIEGTFSKKDVFPNQQTLYEQHGLGGLFKPSNVNGITSSCMGCHSQAAYYSSVGEAVGMFVADQWVPRNAPWFIGRVQTDFAWSLSGQFEPAPED